MFPFKRYKVVGHSMEPTLKDGQVVWVNSWSYRLRSPKVGDVVVFKVLDQEFIKRITKIKKNKLYLLGDNQEDSFDSRKIGLVDKKNLVGKVII